MSRSFERHPKRERIKNIPLDAFRNIGQKNVIVRIASFLKTWGAWRTAFAVQVLCQVVLRGCSFAPEPVFAQGVPYAQTTAASQTP